MGAHAQSLARIRQCHADGSSVKAVAKQVLGGETLALGLALVGDIEGRAADHRTPGGAVGDELGAR
jgi:hypothetical protein